jgi:hypothetical protein
VLTLLSNNDVFAAAHGSGNVLVFGRRQ